MATSTLADLGIPRHLIEHLNRFDPDSPLGYRCQPPMHYASSRLLQREVVPLWECGTTVTYFCPQSQRFEQCSLEDIQSTSFSVGTVQALLGDLFIDLYEDDHPEEELRELAASVGFLHLDHLLAAAHHHQQRDYYAWRTAYLSRCGG